MPINYPSSLAKIVIRGRSIPILPYKSIPLFIVSLLILALTLLFLDRTLIPMYEQQGKLASLAWQHENSRILEFNRKKNFATTQHPIWHSKGVTFSPSRTHKKRILVMGDSFVWGSGNTNVNDLWWRQLERELETRGYHDLEVMAAGIAGWSTKEQLNAARHIIPQYSPDAIIWGYVTNDPDERIVPQMTFDNRVFGFLNRYAKFVLPNLSALVEQRFNAKREHQVSSGYNDWELKLLESPNFDLYKKTVAELSKYLHTLNIPHLLITLPNYPSSAYFRPRYQPILPLFAASGLEMHDILDSFIARYGDLPETGEQVLAWGINPSDGHPGPRSTRFFAERAADLLEQKCASCLGPKSNPLSTSIAINDWTPPDIDVLQTETTNVFKFIYPDSEDQLLFMPHGKPHIQINLTRPVRLQEIHLSGPSLIKAELSITTEDPESHYDDGVIRSLKVLTNKTNVFSLPDLSADAAVNTIRISALFSTPDHTLSLGLIPTESQF